VTRLRFESAFFQAFSRCALCSLRKGSIFQQDNRGHARWLKAGTETFSFKGEVTVIPGKENLVALQRRRVFSLPLHSWVRISLPGRCFPHFRFISDNLTEICRLTCHAVIETVLLGIALHLLKASDTQIFKIQKLSDRE